MAAFPAPHAAFKRAVAIRVTNSGKVVMSSIRTISAALAGILVLGDIAAPAQAQSRWDLDRGLASPQLGLRGAGRITLGVAIAGCGPAGLPQLCCSIATASALRSSISLSRLGR
jgi:hypothetical protein